MNQPAKLGVNSERNFSTKLRQVKTLLPPALRDPAMLQPQIKFAHDSRKRRRSGMTLIELLIAVSILVIIAAILVPQLRFASADRNIREASRTAASLFAQASQRAINDGEAGVVIERNPNIQDLNTGNFYAGTSMFMLRKVPRYIGEDGDEAELVRTSSVDTPNEPAVEAADIFITMPLEQDALGIVRVGDQISFNEQKSVRFVITKTDFTVAQQTDSVDGQRKLRLRIAASSDFLADAFPDPDVSEDPNVAGKSRKLIGSFTVYRQPRKLISSRVDMPTGYLVDLRLSGEMATTTQTYFDLDNRGVDDAVIPNSISYVFNGRGSIDRFFYSVPDGGGGYQRLFNIPNKPAYLMVREYSTDDGGELIANVLGSERTMWVTVEPVTGAANVVSGVAIDLNNDFGGTLSAAALRAARTLSSQGQQAAQ